MVFLSEISTLERQTWGGFPDINHLKGACTFYLVVKQSGLRRVTEARGKGWGKQGGAYPLKKKLILWRPWPDIAFLFYVVRVQRVRSLYQNKLPSFVGKRADPFLSYVASISICTRRPDSHINRFLRLIYPLLQVIFTAFYFQYCYTTACISLLCLVRKLMFLSVFQGKS